MAKKKSKNKNPLRIVQSVVYINGIVWVILALVGFFSGRQYFYKGINVYDLYSFLMVLFAVFTVAYAKLLEKKIKFIYWIGVFVFVITAILSFTDQFGLADFLIFIVNFIPVFFLLKYRKGLIN